jgi:hypothetical protein
MLSVSNLFEVTTSATFAPPAQGVMAPSQEYVKGRIESLKSAFSRGRIKAGEYMLQMAELRKNMRNPQMGVTQF